MKVLLSYIHFPVSCGRRLKRAFRNLGHDVFSIGPYTGGYIPWQPNMDSSKYADVPDIEIIQNRGPKEVERVVSRAVESFAPDMIVQCDAHFVIDGYFDVFNVVYAID